MHWRIGQLLYERKLEKEHGASVVKHLSVDLKHRYPDMGLSERNLWDMKRFYVRAAAQFRGFNLMSDRTSCV